ncbi:MAG: hypothetical protein A3F11_08320 [Gammaproteobacteria bacterium RIFCSPHIGHO2_12_FULL_37_14]|nr:MAG: hypothetical protein A3F11_08320 [Gammaproteobacteria bacterium RIFCSPHIGHO2_12_FULL_37_14]
MAAPAQQGGQPDNSAGIIWGVVASLVTLGVIWYSFRDYIISAYLTLKLYEINFLSLFSNRFEDLRTTTLSALTNTSKLNFADLMTIGDGVGDWLRIPLVIIMIVLAFVVYLSNSARVFRRTYSMQELAKLEKDNWPQIAPVVNLNLLKQDIDKGAWAMAMTPMQFCKKNKLLEEVRPQRREGVSRKEWDRIQVILRRGEANKIFALQLGQLWKGVDKLAPHVKALFAIFSARINADTQAAAKLIRQLNVSSTSKLNMAGVDALLKKHLDTKIVQKNIHSYAYVLTVMAAMLESARDDGVQASADFLWLKPLDRRLWYTLNTVGRQTPFVEVAGVFGHWLAEKEAGRKLVVPAIEEATKALEIALSEVVYLPDEEKST